MFAFFFVFRKFAKVLDQAHVKCECTYKIFAKSIFRYRGKSFKRAIKDSIAADYRIIFAKLGGIICNMYVAER